MRQLWILVFCGLVGNLYASGVGGALEPYPYSMYKGDDLAVILQPLDKVLAKHDGLIRKGRQKQAVGVYIVNYAEDDLVIADYAAGDASHMIEVHVLRKMKAYFGPGASSLGLVQREAQRLHNSMGRRCSVLPNAPRSLIIDEGFEGVIPAKSAYYGVVRLDARNAQYRPVKLKDLSQVGLQLIFMHLRSKVEHVVTLPIIPNSTFDSQQVAFRYAVPSSEYNRVEVVGASLSRAQREELVEIFRECAFRAKPRAMNDYHEYRFVGQRSWGWFAYDGLGKQQSYEITVPGSAYSKAFFASVAKRMRKCSLPPDVKLPKHTRLFYRTYAGDAFGLTVDDVKAVRAADRKYLSALENLQVHEEVE